MTDKNTVLCQVCGTPNSRRRELCGKCGHKLLVVSGPGDEEHELSDDDLFQAQEDLEEHLLERITALEDSVRRLSEAIASTAGHVAQLEHNLTVAHAGVQALGSLLETQGVLSRAEVVDGWERTAGQELLSRDLSRRFRECSTRILSLAAHSGDATAGFRKRLRALELALLGPQTELAIELLTELTRTAPSNDELWRFFGEVAFRLSELETARVAFSRVLDLRGAHYETLIYLGTVASDLGHYEEAETHLLRAREMWPEAFLPHFTLGALAIVRGDHRTAASHLEASLLREELPQALYLIGVCRLELGEYGRAIDVLRRAVELEPDFDDALYKLGLAYLRRGWSRLALETFQQVLRIDPQRLQYQETVRLLSLKPPQDLPREAARLVASAEAALERGRPEAALDLFVQAVNAAPGQPELTATTALLASALGRARLAIGHAHWLLRQDRQDSPYLAAAVVALLESLRHAGRPRAARRLARRLYANEEDRLARGMAAYELALVESELGDDLAGARELAREALEITPRELRHYPLAALGSIALKRGRFKEATQYLEQAAEVAPLPLLLRQLAVARLGAGDRDGAQQALDASQDEAAGGLDQELLGHVRRLGSLVDDLARRRVVRNGARDTRR